MSEDERGEVSWVCTQPTLFLSLMGGGVSG